MPCAAGALCVNCSRPHARTSCQNPLTGMPLAKSVSRRHGVCGEGERPTGQVRPGDGEGPDGEVRQWSQTLPDGESRHWNQVVVFFNDILYFVWCDVIPFPTSSAVMWYHFLHVFNDIYMRLFSLLSCGMISNMCSMTNICAPHPWSRLPGSYYKGPTITSECKVLTFSGTS